MKTISEIIIDSKCRKGGADGTTVDGAFWVCPASPIIGNLGLKTLIRSFGGDGVGQSRADLRNYLELRHYRGGKVQAVVLCNSWHQNYGNSHTVVAADSVLAATTTEELEVALMVLNGEDNNYYSESMRSNLDELAETIGLPESLPAPDEVDDGIREANVCLISAAPNLLAALESLSLCVGGMDQSSLDGDFAAARDQARAAISKATEVAS